MSTSEILVSLFGLFLGYWVISKLITGKKIEADNHKKPERDKNSKNDFEHEKSEDQDWYVVLGVSRNATIDEVQAAYKSLIRQYHPDKVASLGEELGLLAERKSKAINVAYKQAQEPGWRILKTLMLLFAAGKFGKFLISGGSMLIAIGTYTIIYGWKYALGFVFLLLIHELGHYIAAGKRGLPVGLPTFIPIVGAWIELKEQPMDAETEAFVAIAGPMLGSAAAFICYLIAKETNEGIFLALAYAGFMLNLFNLIPLSPLDGGRVMAAISPKLWFIGLPMLIALFIWKPSPIIILIGLFALPQLWNAFTNRALVEFQYYQVPNNIKVSYAMQYLALVIFLTVLTIETHDSLSSVRSSY